MVLLSILLPPPLGPNILLTIKFSKTLRLYYPVVVRDSSVGIATRYVLTVRGSNLGGGEIFRTRPDRHWGPPSLLYNGYWVSFPGVKRPGCGVDHLPPASAEVKDRVELYLYALSGPLWPVLGRTLPLPILPSYIDRSSFTPT
jgi:hypothetical protein